MKGLSWSRPSSGRDGERTSSGPGSHGVATGGERPGGPRTSAVEWENMSDDVEPRNPGVRDPEVWREQLAGSRFQARKRVAAKVLLRDEQRRVLWSILSTSPSGTCLEAWSKQRSAHQAALRNYEELGLV